MRRHRKEGNMYATFNRFKRLCGVIAAGLILSAGLVPVSAEGSSTETVNNIGLGNVSISLNEFRVDAAGKETPIEGNSDRKIVLPGETISKLSRITVNGHKSWIRAKVMVSGDAKITDLDPSWVILAEDEHWLKKKDFWYYTEPVDHGKTIRFTKEVRVPDSEENTVKNTRFDVVVWADAVQYDNFKPDFDAEDPWFGTVIETSVYDTFRNKETGEKHFYVSYEGGAQGLIANTGDLFDNFRTLMPGDRVQDSVVIGNGYSQPVRLYFRIEGTENDSLARQIRLRIKAGEVPLFSGTLADAMNEIYLAYMTPKWQAVLTYELEVPDHLKNEFELEDTSQKWIFRAELPGGQRIVPRTGDSTRTAVFKVLLACSAAAGAAALVILRRTKSGRK